MRHQAHHQSPDVTSVRLALAYKNFAALKGISHIGLGVAARNTAAVLRQAGFRVEVWPIGTGDTLEKQLAAAQQQAYQTGEHPFSHVVVSAPWLPTVTYQRLTLAYPEVVFALSSHSNVGFLQADPNGVQLLRESYELTVGAINFHAAGNCRRYTDWVERTYGVPCQFLPNLYDLSNHSRRTPRQPWRGGVLRIGCFGATRPLKNLLSAVAAAMEIGKRLNADVEIWISSGRDGGDSSPIRRAIAAMTNDVPQVKLVVNHWQTWPAFRKAIAGMHLLLQPSYSESFNIVTADGVAEGVPTVTSEAIDWVPVSWQANSDSVQDIADRGIALLFDPYAAQSGHEALAEYVAVGTAVWRDYLLRMR